jgi:two-component system phosphate regulon sensor histidine kinase PhoR
MCLNVIENAIKYTGEGGWVNVILDQNDEYIVLSVEDNGVGISQDQLPFIYDRFYRVDKARSKSIPGSGLGLSIVRWIVEAHKGTIEATSEEGKGTTFVISIPRA